MTWTETIERYIAEGRTVSGGKGADQANSQRQTELGMQQTAFNTQQSQLAALNKAFSPYTTGSGQGFSPSQMSQMTSQFLNSNNQTFNQAGQQVRSALGARGEGTGQNPVGGLYGGNIASLLGAKAGSQSQGILGLNVQNAMQALTNKFNAGNILSGNAATLTGTQGVAGSAASSALSSYINAANGGFLGALGQGLGKGLGQGFGSGIGAGLSGGVGNALSSVGNGNMGW